MLDRWLNAIFVAMLLNTAWLALWFIFVSDIMILCSKDTPGAGGLRFAPPCPPPPTLFERVTDIAPILVGIAIASIGPVRYYALPFRGKWLLLGIAIFGVAIPVLAFTIALTIFVAIEIVGWLYL